jgi:hypothetical protein
MSVAASEIVHARKNNIDGLEFIIPDHQIIISSNSSFSYASNSSRTTTKTVSQGISDKLGSCISVKPAIRILISAFLVDLLDLLLFFLPDLLFLPVFLLPFLLGVCVVFLLPDEELLLLESPHPATQALMDNIIIATKSNANHLCIF